MNRIDLVKTLLCERTISSRSQRSFLDTKYEYLPGHKLFTREAHFLSAVQPGGSSGTELAEALRVSLGSVSQTANSLESKGYITRCKSATDKRQSMFFLTELGAQLQAAHNAYDEASFQIMSDRLACYTDEELAQYIAYEQQMAKIFFRTKHTED